MTECTDGHEWGPPFDNGYYGCLHCQEALSPEHITAILNEHAQLEATLALIGDVTFDRDGYTGDAEKLGELIDEIYGYARNPQLAVDALKEE